MLELYATPHPQYIGVAPIKKSATEGKQVCFVVLLFIGGCRNLWAQSENFWFRVSNPFFKTCNLAEYHTKTGAKHTLPVTISEQYEK